MNEISSENQTRWYDEPGVWLDENKKWLKWKKNQVKELKKYLPGVWWNVWKKLEKINVKNWNYAIRNTRIDNYLNGISSKEWKDRLLNETRL